MRYTVTHVFLPITPEAPPYDSEGDHRLVCAVCAVARAYSEIIDDTLKPQWRGITKMLDNLEASIRPGRLDTEDHVTSLLWGMRTGDILAFFNRVQDAVVIFRKQDQCTLYESFQTSWDSGSTLARSYPEWAVEIPNEVFHKQYFQSELAKFLLFSDRIAKHSKDGITYTKLLTSILRGVGRSTEVPCITKYIHSRVGLWRRSPLWFLIKVVIQTSLDRSGLGRLYYKTFMLRFMCSLAKDSINANLSSRLLHAISAKILRRQKKLGASCPDWLYDMVLKTNASLRETLEARWKEVDVTHPLPSLWKPSQLDLDGDTQLSLLGSIKYIRDSLANVDSKPLGFPFCPKHLPRGTLNDFLSSNGSFFEEAYCVDPYVTLYDVEQAVEQGIDDWVGCVTDVDEACIQLAILMDKYLASSWHTYPDNPEHISIMLLTVFGLWVALDKLVIAAIPMLANYSPEIPTNLLHGPLLRTTMNLHHLRRTYQYLSARHSQFLPGNSIFSKEFTINTFPVHKVLNPPFLQPHIEGYGCTIPSHVDIAVFELRCSVSLHIWRSATARLLGYRTESYKWEGNFFVPLADIPRLRLFLVKHWTSPDTGQVYLTCLAPSHLNLRPWDIFDDNSSTGYPTLCDEHFVYWHPSSRGLHQYVNATSHTSNGVLAAQAKCPHDLSLSEFIAFGHLRSGCSLQWLNILRELRSRTLNFRRQDVHLLFAQAASQVGPLDLNTAEWLWHQELQESSFCSTLLDELESLYVDIGVYSLDGVMMGTISFLLTRLLASCCYEDILERGIGLLRQVRTKAFEWVQELSYNLMMAPTSTERSKLLRDMAATCRSTFDVGHAILHKLLYSAEDVEALLSCAIFIHANSTVDSERIPEYPRLLLERDRRLSLTLEGILRDVILADPSDRGIDLAVRNVWPGYRPGPRRWQPLPHPNSNWLTCETAATGKRRSQIVHFNLLNGVLLVDGKPIDGLPHEIRNQVLYKRIFGNQVFLTIASDLPGMDLSPLALISDHRVHFALQGGNLVIRAQHRDTADILEVIPQEKLQGDLPAAFVHGHVHWFNLSTLIVEIRPLEKIWEHSLDNWRIECATEQYRMYKGHECLVDVHSPTWKMVSHRLKCLDVPENLIITTLPIDTHLSSPVRRVSVVLPRYSLSFFVNEDGDLESRDFKGMVYDENQCIGTLFGLKNRLVLRPNIQVEEELVHRCVIIPDGLSSRERHSRRSLSAKNNVNLSQKPVAYHIYRVDTDLGCLTGYTSWRSKLYLAQLHIQTSVDWRPDPLTGRTGIQEALWLLRSAACRSIRELDTRHEAPEPLSSPHYKIYPQISFAIGKINYLIERERFLYPNQHNKFNPPTRPQLDVMGALQTTYLFPLEDAVPKLPALFRADVMHHKSSSPEDFVYTVSLVIYCWLVNTENEPELWGDTECVDTLIAALKRAIWHPLPPSMIAEVDPILREIKGARQLFRLLFLLPMTVYCHEYLQPAFLSVLMALARRFLLEGPLYGAEYWILDRYNPSQNALLKCFADAKIPGEEDLDAAEVDELMMPWSLPSGTVTQLQDYLYDVEKLNTELQRLFSTSYRNLDLNEHFTNPPSELETELYTFLESGWVPHSRQTSNPLSEAQCCMPGQVTLGRLLLDRSAPKLPAPSRLGYCGPPGNRPSSDSDTHTLNQLFASIRMDKTNPSFQKQYISRLHDSTRHAREASRGVTRRPSTEELRRHYVRCRDGYMAGLTIVKKELGPMNDLGHALDRAGQWPQITPNTLFPSLASISPIGLPGGWKQCLVSLALLLVELQRSRRLLRYSLDNLEEELSRELENEGCDGWSAEEHPDWLLIQLQGDFLIRGVQADVTLKMISPPSGENTAMQVNMGEGKSSVILPISAATLADGNRLVRVVVPKPLAAQMFRLLVDRLGGLVNRPIYHLPFSRSLTGRYSRQQIGMLREMLSECVRDHGILVVQPEHVLSLKLTSVEKQLPTHYLRSDDNGNQASRSALLKLQRWVQSCSRDVLDEVDEVLHPRFQPTYTIGCQQHMEGYPNRWTITQQILRLVRKHALSLSHDLPDAIEYELDASGSFPRIRILRASDARQRLISLIMDDVMNGHLPNFNFHDINRDRRLRAAVCAFVSSKDVFQRTASMVEEYAQQSNLWDGILLLRGLLACNILLFALAERRWRVDYGLSPKRTLLAVPYRAKDVPAPRAEFGHPDITIVLTCLSYYYGGLTEEQLRVSFEILQEQDEPSMEYANWLRDYDPESVPKCIQDLRNVNIKSSEQWDRYLFPLFARNQGAVDFYLSRVVFPKEAKEFPWKITASSWDLAEIREHPMTGFSGTNDCQDLLPTSITQHDPDHQRGTTARVLSYLLQSENSSYELISHANGNRRTTFELLRMVVDQAPQIRVFLDVGAQILDFSNYQVAKAWLGLSSDSDGAIYFNEDDEPMVLTKDGNCRALISSPLAQQLERCVVYLDDAHTRGTDLKFPTGFRAAVTLGPKVTKDRLVQGCMRMRKLGHGHSVMFLAPLEVDGSIRAVAAKDDHKISVTTTDILLWAIHETWTDIQERAPYWAQQGISHNSRYKAWTSFCNNELTREQLADAWLQPELKSLTDLYAPSQPQNIGCSSVLDDYPEMQQHCIDLGVLKLPDAQMEEEQEREVNREIEREREMQQQPRAAPAAHSIHPEVVTFIKTGVIPPLHSGSAFHPVFTTLEQSPAAAGEAHVWSPFVLATTDFRKTVDPASFQGRVDQYLRPVQWVLSGKRNRVLVILSPFEADWLMPVIRVSIHVHLHVYTPRTSKYMRPADDLMFYSIPPVTNNWTPPWDLIVQLNVFAGQLYLRDYASYLSLLRFLDIHRQELPKSVGTAIRHNLITPSVLEEIGNTFTDSPLPSVMMLLASRRRGLPFAETHMGRILQGQLLAEEDFKSPVWAGSSHNPTIRYAQVLHSVTSATTEKDGPVASVLSQSPKRGRETLDPSDGDSGRSQKRLRVGQQ